MTEREELLLVALKLGAIAESLDAAPYENADLAYARERIDVLRGILGKMIGPAMSDVDTDPQSFISLRSRERGGSMKTITAVAVLALATLASSFILASADGEQVDRANKPKVACFHYGSSNVSFKAKPRRCDFMRPGCDIGACDLPTKNLKWSHWGRPHATATGKGFITTVGWRPIKLQLSKIRNPKCNDRLVYTKLKARYKSSSTSGSSRLDRCRR